MALRPGDKTFEIDCEVKHATERALLIIVQRAGSKEKEEMWVPKSQLAEESEIGHGSEPGDTGTIEMSEWIAGEKGLLV